MKHCERCGGVPEIIREGTFAGEHHELPYCALCSKDLCEKCLAEGHCREAEDHRHKREVDCETCDGSDKNCNDCHGTGVVLR